MKLLKIKKTDRIGIGTNCTFIQWEITKEQWVQFSLIDKIKTVFLFRVILPKSKLILPKE